MKIEEIKTPQDMFNFMSENIKYGWVDFNNNVHTNIHTNEMIDIRSSHKLTSVEETLKYKVGTCIEQAILIKYLLSKINIPNRLFCIRNYESSDNVNLKAESYMHCFVLYYLNDKVYQLEYPNPIRRGIHEYNSEEEAMNDIINYYKKKDNTDKERTITEFYDIESGWSFIDFNNYINDLDMKKSK